MEETKTFVINGFKIDITSITLTDGQEMQMQIALMKDKLSL